MKFEFITGFESTRPIPALLPARIHDMLGIIRHYTNYKTDLGLVADLGIRKVRISVPWHRIERVPGRYNWAWMDRYMNRVQELGMTPILDPLHHTSFPNWLLEGFLNPDFPVAYQKFLRRIAARYPWVKDYTVINEPYVTTYLCGWAAHWYPYGDNDRTFMQMLRNVAITYRNCSRMLSQEFGATIVHVEACEQFHPHDSASMYKTDFNNQLRFLLMDVLLGTVTDKHPLYEFMMQGFSDEDLESLRTYPAVIDVMGLDYYLHCESSWHDNQRMVGVVQPVGFANIAIQYAQRYKLPLMLSETNIRGTVADRITWLKYMLYEYRTLGAMLEPMNIPLLGFCWYPVIDCCNWCNGARQVCYSTSVIDPQGLYYLTKQFQRRASELTEIVTHLTSHRITFEQIPAYKFSYTTPDLVGNIDRMETHGFKFITQPM